jgi:hypothetical protein
MSYSTLFLSLTQGPLNTLRPDGVAVYTQSTPGKTPSVVESLAHHGEVGAGNPRVRRVNNNAAVAKKCANPRHKSRVLIVEPIHRTA